MDFNYLDIAKLELQTAPDGTLRAIIEGDRCGLRVEAMNALPLSHPEEYIVLRDGKKAELGVLRDLKELAPAAAQLVREQLHRRYFLPRVSSIVEVAERFGSMVWTMETDRGQVTATTKQMSESVFEISPGRYLITDVDGNRYEIKDVAELDEQSQERFRGKL